MGQVLKEERKDSRQREEHTQKVRQEGHDLFEEVNVNGLNQRVHRKKGS